MVQILGLTAFMLIGGIVGLVVVADKYKPLLALLIVIVNSVLTSIPSIAALVGVTQSGILFIPHILGNVIVSIDPLSAWFILIINFTSINGVLFGRGYLKSYSHLGTNLELHWVFYTLFHLSMLWVCMLENGLAFIIAWELMSLSSLFLVIFEYQNKETLKAGINYMVQMHLSVLFLTVGILWLYMETGSFDFSGLADLPDERSSIWPFVMLFIGFAIKAGFIPFHTWLPHAHPAAPSHISGVMSGVIVKLGIYGIFRIIAHLRADFYVIGGVILALSLLTALYGIINAALKCDFKRMLAFCTIENIGIIGIGIGIGLMGKGNGNTVMMVFGFGAALLHTLNHSLFKSLLFFGAGSVYQQTHTRYIERLGGLAKQMPITAVFFLIGALAIGGLPPFNGFVSEYLIYSGLVKGLGDLSSISGIVLFILTIAGLALVGGMSLLTFTKTFGLMFLGNPRAKLQHEPKESPFSMHLPQYLIVLAMLSIAIFPGFYLNYAMKVVTALFPMDIPNLPPSYPGVVENISMVGRVCLLFLVLLSALLGIRWLFSRKRESYKYETWGCGYVAPVVKAQYTGRSFSRSFGDLFNFMVNEKKEYKKISKAELYPGRRSFSTFYFDVLERYCIKPVARRMGLVLNYFQFIQNGRIQSYVIYGLFFIILVFLGTVFNIIN